MLGGEGEGSCENVKHWESRRPRMPVVWILWSCLLMATVLRRASADLAHETAILLSLKRAWGNPDSLSSWSSSVNVCSPQWLLVTCDPGNTTVTEITLYAPTQRLLRVYYPIPENIAELVNLEVLIVHNWVGLAGEIPASIGRLRNLRKLDLGYNYFLNGSIPPELGNLTKLVFLDLSHNSVSGRLPVELLQLRRLRHLNLNHNKLNGTIASWMGSFEELVLIDLSSNFLTGQIPEQLTTLPKLDRLYLQDNCLNGTVPSHGNNSLIVDFGLDGFNCFKATQPCKCDLIRASRKAVRYTVIGALAGGCLLGLIALLIIYVLRRKPLDITCTYQGPVQKYTLVEVMAATENLTTIIGAGAYATVYKAVFQDGTDMAVKRFNRKAPAESFLSEGKLLSRLNHRFLVNLVGYCEDAGELMLLYEFMNRGNLFDNLHDLGTAVPLTWGERTKVLVSVARGIDYLHYGTSRPMIHRDIKSANILLSSDGSTLTAKLADFGIGVLTEIDNDEMAAAYGNGPPQPYTTRVIGTMGYLDPQYYYSGIVSPKTDVYSFGVVLVELITGRQAVITEDNRRMNLADWARPILGHMDVWTIVDPNLERDSIPAEQLSGVATLAHDCLEPDGEHRPTIIQVLERLAMLFNVQAVVVDPPPPMGSIGELPSLARSIGERFSSTSPVMRLWKSLTGEASGIHYTELSRLQD